MSVSKRTLLLLVLMGTLAATNIRVSRRKTQDISKVDKNVSPQPLQILEEEYDSTSAANLEENGNSRERTPSSFSIGVTEREASLQRVGTEKKLTTTTAAVVDEKRQPAAVEKLGNSVPRVNCTTVAQLRKCAKVLSTGRIKQVYAIELPSGDQVIVKYCKNKEYCMNHRSLHKEAAFLTKLQDAYGSSKTLGFYGACNHVQDNRLQTGDNYMNIMEKGEPLLVAHGNHITNEHFRNCLASYLKEADLEDFKTIARQYAGFPEYPIYINDPQKKKGGKPYNSQIYIEQYVLSRAGIRHIDTDDMTPCPKCSYQKVLEFNCETMRKVTNRKDLNCTEEYSLEHPVQNWNLRINATEANLKCGSNRMVM